jgi:hypothetical protein
MARKKKTVRRGLDFHNLLQVHVPSGLPTSHYILLLKAPSPHNSTTLRTKPLTYGALEDIQDPNYSTLQRASYKDGTINTRQTSLKTKKIMSLGLGYNNKK